MKTIKADLSNKVALVTGAGRGIGKHIALSLAENGAKVIAVSRTKADLENVKEEIVRDGGSCTIMICDVQDITQVYNTVETAYNQEKKLDILVNSAGLNIQAHTLEVTEEQWDTIMSTNLKGAFFVSQAVAKKMKQSKEGKIINITSDMALVGFYDRAAYCASKGGLTQATKAMAIELAEYNINVNCVAPAFIETPLTKPMLEDKEFYCAVISRTPLGRIGTPEDVSGAVLYLASESANLVTGSTILVDGGWVAW